ncbi:Fc.00g113340.m01.CDS01 [Cosmosporella sp. VM-42]
MASPNNSSTAAHASASLLINEAVNRFKATVTRQDLKQIQTTQVDDVVAAMRVIEQDLKRRRENRNLVKVYRFVQGLQKYAGAIEALSNGLSPYLPWVWEPIKLMLQIASDHMLAFDKLIEAYDRIAETLPRLDRLAGSFKDDPGLLTKLALYYEDVLDFHRRAYKFVKRNSWKFFFDNVGKL